MNEISGISDPSILQELNQRNTIEGSDNGQGDFLKLLVAQLNNQDPLSPQDNGEFLSQLAQFSSVEGIERLNQTMDQLASSMLSNQALQATALVGRSVQIPVNIGQLNSGYPLTGSVDLPTSTSDMLLSVFSENGQLVRQIPMGAHSAGLVNFSWDGFDSNGEAMPSGVYRITADANLGDNAEQVPVYVNANVDSVTMGQSGGVMLNLEGTLGSVSLSQVLQIK